MQNRLRNGLSFLLATKQRKLVLLVFVAAFVALYYYSTTSSLPTPFAGRKKASAKPKSSSPCAQQILSQWDSLQDSDISIHVPSHFHSPPFQFIGNGWVGSCVGASGMYISHQGYLSVAVPVSPFVEASINGHKMSHEASVIEFKKGLLHHIFVYKNNKGQCVTLQDTVYAHHTKTALIMEELHFKNGMDGKVTVQLSHIALNSWTGSTRRKSDFKVPAWSRVSHYHVVSGKVKADVGSSTEELSLSMASTDPPESFSLGSHGVLLTHLASVVVYNTSSTPHQTLETMAEKELQSLVGKKPDSLRSSHSAAWVKSYVSNVDISTHDDTSIPQQATVTASLYYIKSALTPTRVTQPQKDKQKQQESHCYTGLPTMHVVSLWTIPSSSSSMLKLVSSWRRHLMDGDCLSVFTNGYTNIEQSILRSIIGLQDTGKLIQLAANPLTLRAPVTITRFLYQNHFLTLAVTLNRQHLPAKLKVVSVQVEGKQAVKPLYVCEAACKSKPMELKLNSPVNLPVIATSPVTPLLFISTDQSSLQEMGKQLRIDKSQQHKEDHNDSSSGHLSAKFWVCLGLLVAAFHVFLLRLVYKEYFYGTGEGTKAKMMSKSALP